MKMIKTMLLLIVALTGLPYSCDKTEAPSEKEIKAVKSADLILNIPCQGNSWVLNNSEATSKIVVDGGIKNWTDSKNKIRTYFYAHTTGSISIGLLAKFSSPTTLKITVENQSEEVAFNPSTNYDKHIVGKFTISKTGYQYVELEGLNKEGESFGDISDIVLGDAKWSSKISYINADSFYWGRRGPSVHLNYEEPVGKNITYFYNEVTVPEGNDHVGSYFMANGFSSGYFGMQVNSSTDRKVLFSVWSAFDTQDPNNIPEEYKVIPLGHGSDVTVKEFGNEGSGAQSYFSFPWKAGTTYKFLLKGESKKANSIDYTAYFYAPEVDEWKLVASFRRPYSSEAHLTRLHSFLENFYTEQGANARKAHYSNHWAYDTSEEWHEMTSAIFTTDNTGKNGVRLDYAGGSEASSFYLKNCGFFSEKVTHNSPLKRAATGQTPNIDFSKLEVPTLTEVPEYESLDRTAWKVIDYSTQEDKGGEGSTGLAAHVLDGKLETYWHSCWASCDAAPPHYITVDMGATTTIDGFKFTQRQNLSRTVKSIELQVSQDNKSWTSLGDFTLRNEKTEQQIELSEPKEFRYFKFIAKTAFDGSKNAAMAEISLFVKK
ncbi:F5/8 type C domain-containing protein [Arenibacter nanhaiticus]|uniref:F5/8 type C domain-containing protein n=1 Tax=Arenibacter nanhaiticus TaxID=558155 RepID=A0A1M6C9A3_9FLAO|nr:DUF3472 domain-containing protein [Arenibacter nanhaiticus]SHI57381.1 F5/8 type C domain-containing protein [Arenibacter nanhaiticus]